MNRKKIIIAILLLGLFCASAFAQTSLAILGYENLNGDPRYDYLGGMLLGITLFDFASNDDITLVNRSDLEEVLTEQQLGLSGIVAGSPETVEIGNMIGAEYLLKGEFVFLGSDLLVTTSIINVSTGAVEAFRERGTGENMVHSMNSKIQKFLTGKNVNLVGQRPDRSLISLDDEKPGSVKLYSHIQQAEVFVDDEFYGYTTGNRQVPLEIGNLKPGTHTIRMHLGEFGVFTDYTLNNFGDWEKEVAISPGQVLVVKSDAAHISDKIRSMKGLGYAKINFGNSENDAGDKTFDTSFTDRKGNEVKIQVSLHAVKEGDKISVSGTLNYNGSSYEISGVSPQGRSEKVEKTFELVDCELNLNKSYVRIDLTRNDIDYNDMIDRFF
ncbi:MAG: hypothetical protein JW874_06935 [Spirochaetales bacterium]|nr:hypothetical protein [Spirochaetales bacterium]